MTVYVLQCQQTRNIKIGYTARLVQSRLSELRTAASTPIELVKWYPGLTEDHEKWFHDTFAQYRVAGEWFKQDVLNFIDQEIKSLFETSQQLFFGA
jgi:T5orf172 domain